MNYTALDTLAKATRFKNLTAASQQIGLSQPQLSRLIRSIEESLGVVLLDRNSKRNSSWTPLALQLTQKYLSSKELMENTLRDVVKSTEPTVLRIGALEGLVDLAVTVTQKLVSYGSLQALHLDVEDLNDLERLWGEGQLDIILTCREPGRRKHNYRMSVGFQSLRYVGKNQNRKILSDYQAQFKSKKGEKDSVLVSNSLLLRRMWIEAGLGFGELPSSITTSRPKLTDNKIEKIEEVLIIGADHLSPKLWSQLATHHR